MKTHFSFLFSLSSFLFPVVAFSCLTSIAYGQAREKLLIGGCGWDRIAIIDKETKRIEWSHTFTQHEDCNDLEITATGNILYAYNRGARLITREQTVLWDFKVKRGEELFTAHQLSSGNYMLAMCGNPSRIVVLNPDGNIIKEDTLNVGIERVHSQFRQITRSDDGGYIIPLMGKGEVVELDRSFRELRRVRCGGNPFSVLQADGHWLVSCGDGHRLVEINPADGSEVRSIDSSALDGITLCFVAEAIRYRNGNILLCNWNGHTEDKTHPLLIELDTANHVVWSLLPSPDIVNISSVCSFY